MFSFVQRTLGVMAGVLLSVNVAYAGSASTQYPIVMVHGFLGSSQLGASDYFYQIKPTLENNGAVVYTPTLTAVNSSTVRGEQLVTFLKQLQAQHGYTKFNLIGHSQGGIDVRYAAAHMPGKVASITTVAAPHKGSFPSDWALKNPAFDPLWLFNLIGFGSNLLNGQLLPQNKQAYLESTSSAGMAAFNAKYPAGVPTSACGSAPEVQNGVYYYSVTGIAKATNLFDISDAYLSAQGLLSSEASDGWIGQCSTHFGKVLKDDFAWNHLDEINQLGGLVGLFQNPTAFYLQQAARLKSKGL